MLSSDSDCKCWTLEPKWCFAAETGGREGEAAAVVGVPSARGVGRGACVGVRPPLGGHVLQRASVGDGLKPYVSAQRGSNKH